MMGGRIEIDSAPQTATRVTLVVPVGPIEDSVPKPPAVEVLRSFAGPVRGYSCPPPAGERRIQILLADDHKVMRQGPAALLSEESDMEVQAEACDGQEAVEIARHLLPDVILMDYSMPRMDGLEATRIIHAEMPDIRIIRLSIYQKA